jgi:hypothetical protein
MSTDDHDLLIEIKTMLQTALTRITGHDQRLDGMDRRMSDAEGDIKVLKASAANGTDVAVLRSAEERGREDSHNRKLILWSAVAGLGTLVVALGTILTIVITSRS